MTSGLEESRARLRAHYEDSIQRLEGHRETVVASIGQLDAIVDERAEELRLDTDHPEVRAYIDSFKASRGEELRVKYLQPVEEDIAELRGILASLG